MGTISRPDLRPFAVAVYEAGDRVFVADNTTGNLYTYDGSTLAEIGSAFIGTWVSDLLVHEPTGKLYVMSTTEDKVVVVDAATGAFIRYLGGSYPEGFTLLQDESLGKVYVLSADTVLTQIDIATDIETNISLSSFITIAGRPSGILAVNPVTHEVFVTRTRETGATSSLDVINGVTLEKTEAFGIGGGALGMGVNWTENKVYVSTGGGVGVPYNSSRP